MAAAVRRAVQHQGSQLQALQWPTAIRAGAIPLDVVNMDSRLRLPVPSTAVLHDWAALQDRRLLVPQQAWNYGAVRGFYMRNISQLVTASNSKRAFLVDTLALVVTCFVFEVYRLESLNLLVNAFRKYFSISCLKVMLYWSIDSAFTDYEAFIAL